MNRALTHRPQWHEPGSVTEGLECTSSRRIAQFKDALFPLRRAEFTLLCRIMAEKKPLSKSQLLSTLAEKTGQSKKDIDAVLEALTEVAYKEAKSVGKFTLPGFGILKLVQRAARVGRSPITGEQIKIPAKTVVKFSVAKAAKEAIVGKAPAKKK
jgi:DNA-binding protein HU-beta